MLDHILPFQEDSQNSLQITPFHFGKRFQGIDMDRNAVAHSGAPNLEKSENNFTVLWEFAGH